MSTGQFLLTLGVALLVFDSKKIPMLIEHVAHMFVTCRRYYEEGMIKFDKVWQQALLHKQLEQNQRKAEEVDKYAGSKFTD